MSMPSAWLRTVRAAVAVAGVLAVAGGCSSGSSDAVAPAQTVLVTVTGGAQPTASSKPSTSSAQPTSAAPSTPGPVIDASARSTTAFASPSGNIVCGMSSEGGVRCDVAIAQWSLPKKPADCELAWGDSVSLFDGRVALACHGDTVLYSAAVGAAETWWNGQPGSQVVTAGERGQLVALAYGASIRSGGVTCTSQTDGVHCTDAKSGRGFDISRTAYTLR